jgi:hypothetical protein
MLKLLEQIFGWCCVGVGALIVLIFSLLCFLYIPIISIIVIILFVPFILFVIPVIMVVFGMWLIETSSENNIRLSNIK